MSSMVQQVYDIAPRWAQELLMALKSANDQRIRRGGQYRQFLKKFQSLQWASEDEIHAWRINRFRNIFVEAAANIPYYNYIFQESGIDPQAFDDFDLLRSLPLLEKQALRDQPAYYMHPKRKAVYVGLTGGTTGMPLASPHDAESMQYSFAMMDRFYMQCGVRWEEKSVYLGAKAIVSAREKSNFQRLDRATGTMFMSMRHMSSQTLLAYVEGIKAYSPQYIRGIASFLYDIARWIEENNHSGQVHIPFIFPTSETLSDDMRKTIERAFSGRVFDYYGSTEGVPIITQCRAGRYHIVPESGYVEFLRPNGSHADPEEPAEMVMTSFRCRLRPLLRYRVMDSANYSLEKCPCGLNWPVVRQINGRLAEWIVTLDGRAISCMGDLIMKSGTELGFREIQVIQIKPDYFEVLAVKAPDFQAKSEEILRKRFVENMYHDITMKFNYTDKIEKSSGGKRRLIISKPAQGLYDKCYRL